jgi:hypothetical protein
MLQVKEKIWTNPPTARQSVKNIMQVPNASLNDKYIGMSSDVGRSLNGAFKFFMDRVWKQV